MKILLCIGIVLLIIMGAIGIYLVCRIAAYQHLQTQMMASVNPSILTGETSNGTAALEGLHIWEEIPNCTLMLQVFFNCPSELYIIDFSQFTEENRLVGLQIFDIRRKGVELDHTDPQIIKNVILRRISDIGAPESESQWLWYFPEQERWS